MKIILTILFLVLSGCARANSLAPVSRFDKSFGAHNRTARVIQGGVAEHVYSKDNTHVRVISKDGLALYVRYLSREAPDESVTLQDLDPNELDSFLVQCDPVSVGWREKPSKSFRDRYWERNDGKAKAMYNQKQLHVMTVEWLKRREQQE